MSLLSQIADHKRLRGIGNSWLEYMAGFSNARQGQRRISRNLMASFLWRMQEMNY
jgi:hypothetical protein